jgi:hypothetical protein
MGRVSSPAPRISSAPRSPVSESRILHDTLLALSALTYQNRRAVPILWRETAGTFTTLDGSRIVRVGLDGITDIVGTLCDGRSLYVEVKSATGTLRPDQVAFRDQARRACAVWVLARSAEDACGAVMAALANRERA